MLSLKRRPIYPITRSGFYVDQYGHSTWYRDHSANASFLVFGNYVYMYFRGIANGLPSTCGVWRQGIDQFDARVFDQAPGGVTNPIISYGASGSVDGSGIYDPCVCPVLFKGKIYLAYMATGTTPGANTYSRICMATSTDALTFTKQGFIGVTGGTPALHVSQDGNTLLLYYTVSAGNGVGYKYVVATSTDGTNFTGASPVVAPSGVTNNFDALGISTLRVFYENGYYYGIYGGSPYSADYPEGFGMIRSPDGINNWTRYNGNPIFLRGPTGGADEAGVWSGAGIRLGGKFYMVYEGVGSNAGANTPNSNLARDTAYGGYNSTSFSYLFTSNAELSFDTTKWDVTADLPLGDYYIQNIASGKFLTPDVSNRVSTQSYNTSLAQKWTLSFNVNNFYTITNKTSGLVLEIQGGGRYTQAYAGTFTSNGGQAQQWKLNQISLTQPGEGVFEIVNRYSGMSLGPNNNQLSDNAFVDQNVGLNLNTQKWLFFR